MPSMRSHGMTCHPMPSKQSEVTPSGDPHPTLSALPVLPDLDPTIGIILLKVYTKLTNKSLISNLF